MQIEQVKPNDLKEFDQNPRIINPIDLENLKKNIQKFGVIDPLIIDENNLIIGGHQRLKAIKELGLTEVPCVRVTGLSENEKKVLNLSLNRIMGDWDETKLTDLLGSLRATENTLLEFSGFTANEVNNLLGFASVLPSDAIDRAIPSYEGGIGTLSGMRYALTFFFNGEEEKNVVFNFFKQERTKELDSNKLLKLIR